MYLSGEEIRQRFIRFFESKGHRHLPGSSLVPHNDPTVLLTTAGMLQFKPVMFGLEKPEHRRVATYQKCFRTTDLDNVGRTPRHHTFFVMLGNFSFGDYYKAEVIPWAWEFLTRELGIPEAKLSVTVFETDDEAAQIWQDKVGLAPDRIVRLGADSNFWAAGDTGPCGPCSEIYYDQGSELGCGQPDCKAGCDCNRFLEVWNLVFMEFNRTDAGTLEPLPAKNIDTGMGLERITSVVQGVPTNYDTDLLRPLMDEVSRLAGVPYQAEGRSGLAMRIIADHSRASAHLIHDGVLPSNEGRGYVLRRVMRRALRYGRLIGLKGTFLHALLPTIVQVSPSFPGLAEQQARISSVIKQEEERFLVTVERGSKRLDEIIQELKAEGATTIPGAQAFELYDTYGFPLELTQEIALESHLDVDLEGYKKSMQEQVERARAAHASGALVNAELPPEVLEKLPATEFLGYDTLTATSTILHISDLPAGEHQVILDRTPFYAESGGQVSDQGTLGGLPVLDVRKVGDLILHHVGAGSLPAVGSQIQAVVTEEERRATMRHHTACHLLQAALREVLGNHVQQAGSQVSPEATRFDFTHPTALSEEQIRQVEERINRVILDDVQVSKEVMSLDEAKSRGALAFFGDKYGETVRVVSVGDFSKEFCGGTHLNRTGEIGLFKIIGEEAIAAGVRRITALTGLAAYRYVVERERILKQLGETLKSPVSDIPARLTRLQSQLTEREKEIEKLRQAEAERAAVALADHAREVGGVRLVAAEIQVDDPGLVRQAAEKILQRLKSGLVVLGAVVDGKATLVAAASEDVAKRHAAGSLIKQLAEKVGAKGGGRPNFAQAGGGTKPHALAQTLKDVEAILQQVPSQA